MNTEIVKAGWMQRQTGVFKRWKNQYCVLYMGGGFSYFSDQTKSNSEGSLHLPTNLNFIKLSTEVLSISPPSNRSMNCLLELQTTSGNLFFCADTADDAQAWKSSLVEVKNLNVRGRSQPEQQQYPVAPPPMYAPQAPPQAPPQVAPQAPQMAPPPQAPPSMAPQAQGTMPPAYSYPPPNQQTPQQTYPPQQTQPKPPPVYQQPPPPVYQQPPVQVVVAPPPCYPQAQQVVTTTTTYRGRNARRAYPAQTTVYSYPGQTCYAQNGQTTIYTTNPQTPVFQPSSLFQAGQPSQTTVVVQENRNRNDAALGFVAGAAVGSMLFW